MLQRFLLLIAKLPIVIKIAIRFSQIPYLCLANFISFFVEYLLKSKIELKIKNGG